jgi:hypothetical protein
VWRRLRGPWKVLLLIAAILLLLAPVAFLTLFPLSPTKFTYFSHAALRTDPFIATPPQGLIVIRIEEDDQSAWDESFTKNQVTLNATAPGRSPRQVAQAFAAVSRRDGLTPKITRGLTAQPGQPPGCTWYVSHDRVVRGSFPGDLDSAAMHADVCIDPDGTVLGSRVEVTVRE